MSSNVIEETEPNVWGRTVAGQNGSRWWAVCYACGWESWQESHRDAARSDAKKHANRYCKVQLGRLGLHPCYECDGRSILVDGPYWHDCPECDGTGRQRYAGAPESPYSQAVRVPRVKEPKAPAGTIAQSADNRRWDFICDTCGEPATHLLTTPSGGFTLGSAYLAALVQHHKRFFCRPGLAGRGLRTCPACHGEGVEPYNPNYPFTGPCRTCCGARVVGASRGGA